MGVSVRKENRVTYVAEDNPDLVVQQRGDMPAVYEVMVPKDWVSEDGTVLLTLRNIERLSRFLVGVTRDLIGAGVNND